MMKNSWLLIIAFVWIFGWGLSHVWPSSWWLEVDRISIVDAKAERPIIIDVNRTIKRPFNAEWRVHVRKWSGLGWQIHCTGHGGGDYRVDSVLPIPLTLEWWTDGSCKTLPKGKYLVSTQWVINGGILPSKFVHAESNIFEVKDVNQ